MFDTILGLPVHALVVHVVVVLVPLAAVGLIAVAVRPQPGDAPTSRWSSPAPPSASRPCRWPPGAVST